MSYWNHCNRSIQALVSWSMMRKPWCWAQFTQFTFRVAAFAHHFVLGPTSTELRLTDQDVPWRHSVLGEAFLGLEVRRSWRWGHTRALTPSQKRKASMILVMKRTGRDGRDPKLRSSRIFFWAKPKRMREFPSYFCFLADIIRPKNPPEYLFWNLGLKGPSDAVGTPGLMSGVKMHLYYESQPTGTA